MTAIIAHAKTYEIEAWTLFSNWLKISEQRATNTSAPLF